MHPLQSSGLRPTARHDCSQRRQLRTDTGEADQSSCSNLGILSSYFIMDWDASVQRSTSVHTTKSVAGNVQSEY